MADSAIDDAEHRRRVRASLTDAQRELVPALTAKGATVEQAEMLVLHSRHSFHLDASGYVMFVQRGRSYRIAPNGRASFTFGG